MNWRGHPLTDYRTIVNLIAATTTEAGLTVKVRLDKNKYQRGIKVSPKELEKIESEITKAEQKLSNPNFTSKAPPHVLQEHQQRLAEWRAKRERIERALEGLQG